MLFAALGLPPAPAAAQSSFDLFPSLTVVQVYDDNLFASSSDREEDYITRLSPRIVARHRSGTLAVDAGYALEAEAFQRHPELNTARARQDASLSLRYQPAPRFTAAGAAGYSDTQTAGELNTVTGLEAGRTPARRFHAGLSLAHRLSARTRVTLDQGVTRDQLQGRPANQSLAAAAAMERRLGPLDAVRLAYGVRHFRFAAEATTFHALTLGWTRRVTPRTLVEVEAGPQLSGRSVGAELSAGLRQRFHRGEIALRGLHTQTTVVGQPGPVTTEGLSATFARQLFGPLTLAGGGAMFRSSGEGFTATVHRLSLDLAWRLTRHLSLAGSHQFSFQRGGAGRRPEDTISHNAVLLRVMAVTDGPRGRR